MMPMLRDRFQELHPTITVEFVGVPAEEMDTRLTTQIAGGNPPDTVFLDMSSVVDYASASTGTTKLGALLKEQFNKAD